ncbi:MAG: cysteine dioxygenase family protein [Chloroflexota bacterium]
MPTLTLRQAAESLAALLHDPQFIRAEILPLLEEGERAKSVVVARQIGEQSSGAALLFFIWPAGATSSIHDHVSWGVVGCAAGALVEERYKRLDDGAQPDVAHLRRIWRRTWRRGSGVSTLLPYEGGIHRISNPGQRPAISVHIYGPRSGKLDGRDYDPARDFVCDRFED